MTRINGNFKTVDNRKFSLKRGFSFFLRGNAVLSIIVIMILSSQSSWNGARGLVAFIMLIVWYEIMIILLSFAACFAPKYKIIPLRWSGEINREKILGSILVIVFLSILSWMWSDQGTIPLLSASIMVLMVCNLIFAFVSIFIQSAVISLFQINVEEKSTNSFSYAFKFLAIFGSGLNYYAQNVCSRLPFLFNKLLSIIFVFCILVSIFIIISIYT